MPETPVVNCVLLWARPGMKAALSAYEDKVLRLVAEHGGRVLERGTVLPGSRHDGEPPTEVQFLEMLSEASLDAYVNDPRRLAMAAERDAAIARTDLFRIQLDSRLVPEHQETPGLRRPRPARSIASSQTEPFRPGQIAISLRTACRSRDFLTVSAKCGGRRVRPGGQHCGQRLGKGPVRPPGPAASQDAHQMRSNRLFPQMMTVCQPCSNSEMASWASWASTIAFRASS